MKCPHGHEGAVLLFNIYRCLDEECRYYDPKLAKNNDDILTDDEIEQKRAFYDAILKKYNKYKTP